jgi:acyl carrier protein
MNAATTRDGIEAILDEVLPDGLPRPWEPSRPLTDAGLDSVGVLELVGAVERRFGITLGDEDLDARNFLTIAGMEALVERRQEG